MQVGIFCNEEELGVRVGGYYQNEQGDNGLGWLEFQLEKGSPAIVLHCLTPNKIRRLAQLLVQAALKMSGEQEQACPAKSSRE